MGLSKPALQSKIRQNKERNKKEVKAKGSAGYHAFPEHSLYLKDLNGEQWLREADAGQSL